MSKSKKELMQEALNYCNELDKSDAYTIQYIQDFAKVSFDTVIKFLTNIKTK